MGMVKIDVAQLKQFAERMRGLASEGTLMGLAKAVAEDVKEKATMRTPVDTGRLKASWTVQQTGDLSAIVENPVEYASFVEFDTRTRSGSIVRGIGMLRYGTDEAKEELEQTVSDHIQAKLGGIV